MGIKVAAGVLTVKMDSNVANNADVVVTCPKASLAGMPAAAATIKFKLSTSKNTKAKACAADWTTGTAVTTFATTTRTSYAEGVDKNAADNLVITFRPATALAANDVITLTPLAADGTTTLGVGANSGVFASNANIACTVAQGGANKAVSGTATDIKVAAGVLTVKMNSNVANNADAVVTCPKASLAGMPATAATIKFKLSTSKNTKAKAAAAHWTIVVPSSSSASSSSASASSSAPTPTPTSSSYASGSSSTTPTPTPTPAAAKHWVSAEVKLAGITTAQFGATEKSNFKSAVSEGLKICGTAGTSQCASADIYDVVATAATRRAGVKVSFKVKVKDNATAKSGATKLSTFLKATGTSGFNSKLKAKGGNLTNVTATVAKEPSAGTSVVVSGVANTAILSLTSMVALGFALLR